jgi:prepilin-type N-terminal cleavage/methylation domain-containing protein
MDPTHRPIGVSPRSAFRHSHSHGGFTLVEVMMAAVVFVMGAVGLYDILLKSYQLTALARYRDDARAVLRTFADQFERLGTSDDTTNYRRELFVTSGETGRGLKYWDATQGTVYGLSNEASNASPFANDAAYLEVTLGGAGSPIPARVTREVVAINPGPTTAATTPPTPPGSAFPAGIDPNYAAGNLWLGTFTITYTVSNRLETQRLSVLRAAP